jgi:hypothetical protein
MAQQNILHSPENEKDILITVTNAKRRFSLCHPKEAEGTFPFCHPERAEGEEGPPINFF